MTRQIKHLFSKERVSVLLKNKRIFNKQGKRDHPFFSLDKERMPQNKTENRSQYGIRLREFKKIIKLYTNLSKRYLKTRIRLFHNYPTKIEENFFRYLESRLDVILCRASFFDSISSAKQAITSGEVQVNQITVKTPAQILKPGDLVSLLPKKEDSLSRNENRFNKEVSSPFKKVETLLLEKSCKKRKSPFSFENLISLIISSTRTEACPCFNKIDSSHKEINSGFSQSRFTKDNLKVNDFLLLNSTATEKCVESKSEKDFPDYAKDIISLHFLREIETENSRYLTIKESLSSFYPDYRNKHYYSILNYYLYLKRVLKKNQTIKQGYPFKDTNLSKKGKPAHLEISYTSLSIVFLFPPQLIRFSDFINYSNIFK